MKDEKTINVYEIQDLYLSAYLMASGKELVAVRRNNVKNNVTFCFKPFQNENEAVMEYYNSRATVSAYGLIKSLEALRSLAHNILKGEKQNGKD